jgi:hypothetical protein
VVISAGSPSEVRHTPIYYMPLALTTIVWRNQWDFRPTRCGCDGSAHCRADDGSFLIFNDLEGPPSLEAGTVARDAFKRYGTREWRRTLDPRPARYPRELERRAAPRSCDDRLEERRDSNHNIAQLCGRRAQPTLPQETLPLRLLRAYRGLIASGRDSGIGVRRRSKVARTASDMICLPPIVCSRIGGLETSQSCQSCQSFGTTLKLFLCRATYT